MAQGTGHKAQGIKERNQGLFYACLAMSFFRGRHQVRRQYPGAKPGSPRAREMVRCFDACVRDARNYIALARLAGFRGSVRATITTAEHAEQAEKP